MKKLLLMALVALMTLAVAAPAMAQDLDCGDPGIAQNMPVTDDPNNFDADNDGIGCETADGVNTTEGNTLEPANIAASASASASASAPATDEQYVPAEEQYGAGAPEDAPTVDTPEVAGADSPAEAAGITKLPETGGLSLVLAFIGAGGLVSLLVGWLLSRRLSEVGRRYYG